MWFCNSEKKKDNTDKSYFKISIMVMLMLALLFGCGKKEYRIINVSEISGNVSVVEDNKEYEAYKGMRLQEGHTIVTSGNSYTRMVLDSDKYIKLKEGSRAKVNTLANGRTEISLERGAITNEIVKPLYEGQSYIIHTPNATLAVRGTYFHVDLSTAEDGDLVTQVYTYGGSVVSQRKLPSGEMIEEAVLIDAGYKATISMDDKDTVYVEEVIDEKLEYVIPIEPEEISDEDLVDLYFAAQNGHEMFVPTETLFKNIENRNIDTNTYTSAYQHAESLGLSGKGTAPDDNLSRIEEAEVAEDKTGHDAPYDGSMDTAKESFGEILEAIISVFVPQDEEVTEEIVIETEGTIENEVATNTEAILGNGTAGETVSIPESGNINNAERIPENGASHNTNNLPETVPGTDNIPEIENTPKEEEVPKVEETDKNVTDKPVENGGGSSSSSNTGGNSAGGSNAGNSGNSGGGSSSGNSGGSSNTPTTCNHSRTTERTEPTCTQDGEEVEKCTICNEVLGTIVLSATGHTEVTETTLEATCTDAGEETIKCMVCQEVIRTEEIPELGHNMVEKETIPATCESGTKIIKECSRCQEEETTTRNDKAQHTPRDNSSVSTTCSYCGSSMIQYTNLTYFDEGLKYVLEGYDTQLPTGYLMADKENEELNALTSLYIDTRQDMVSLKGIEYLTTVEEINLVACSSLQSIDIGNNNNLKTLTVNGCYALTEIDAPSCTNLRTLSITNNQNLLSVNVSNCGRLKNINVSNCKDDFWQNFNASGCSYMNIVNSGSLATNMNFSVIPDKTVIQRITVENTSAVTSINVSGLTGLVSLDVSEVSSNLQSIDASGCTGMTELIMDEFATIEYLDISNTAVQTLKTLTSIKELNIQNTGSLGYVYIGSRYLEKISAQNATGLKCLDIANTSALESLDLSGCSGMESLYLMDTYNLASLNISDCTALGVLSLMNNYGLTILNLNNCKDLEILEINCCYELSTLNIDECGALREVTIILDNKLTELDLSNKTGLTDLKVTNSTSLEIVNVSGCTNLVSFEADASANLKEVNITNCNGLSSLYLYSCPNLQKITITGSGVSVDTITTPNGFSGDIITN